MKVLLYFGHHKVGSTALQAYLARNMLTLLQNGILYPAVESQGLSHLLKHALAPKQTPDLSCMNLREPHNALAFRMLASRTNGKTPSWHGTLPQMPAMLRALRHQIEVFQPHTVVLCSEVFSNFGPQHPDLIEVLQKQFPQAEFELYCALRRPDDYMTSWFGQRLRFGQKLKPLSGGTALDDTRTIHFDYQKMVAPWHSAFQGATLHLRNYADILAAGGSVEDFTTQVGCAFPKGLSHKGPSNPGLPRASFEILRRANHTLEPAQAKLLLRLCLENSKSFGSSPNTDIEVFGAELRQTLTDKFAPINAYLGALVGKDMFFPDLEDMRSPRPISLDQATQDALAHIPSDALADPQIQTFLQSLKQ